MSIEQILFFLLLIAFPLLERLVRWLRERPAASLPEGRPRTTAATASPAHAGPSIPEPMTAEPPMPLPEQPVRRVRRSAAMPPAAPVDPPVQPPAGQRARPARRGNTKTLVTGAPVRHTGRTLLDRRLLTGRDLSRAIILMAVLGRCRALNPHAPSELD
jgi:hypothetical protein